MTCERWSGLLIDHAAGELRDEEAVLLEQHLAECGDCAEALDALTGLLRSGSVDGRAEHESFDTASLARLGQRIWTTHHSPVAREGRRVDGPFTNLVGSWLAAIRRPATILTAVLLVAVGSLIGHVTTKLAIHAESSTEPPTLSAPGAKDTERPERRGPLVGDRPLVDFVSVPSELAGLPGRVAADTL